MVRSRAGGPLRSRSKEKEEKEKGKTNGERKHFGGEEGGDSKVGRGAADGRNGMPWYSPFFLLLDLRVWQQLSLWLSCWNGNIGEKICPIRL